MARMKIKVANRLQGCARALSDLRIGCTVDELARLDEVIRRLNALTADAGALMDGAVVCGARDVSADAASAPRPSPRSVAPSGVVHPLDRPAPIPERTAFHAVEDRAIEDPQTADDVRQAMAVPEGERTEWQRFVVDEYQHLIEFEHQRPTITDVLPAYTAKMECKDLTPREAWLAEKYGYMLQAGWDGVTHPDMLAA